jgi:glycosyltransferase involved in cell wall biosynthesis
VDKNLAPKISVLMPVFNCRQYIEESANSILNQTFTDFEFLIIDDCSTDGTFEYLKTLDDPRITLIRKPKNTGITISLNIGLQMATGEYIARMDGDDISLPDRFAKQVAFMDENQDVIVCGGSYQIIGSDYRFAPNTSNDDIVLDLMSHTPIAHPTVFLRTRTLKKNYIQYDLNYETAEDYKLWTVLSEYGKLANLNDVLLYYRVHQNQITRQRTETQLVMVALIAFEYICNLSRNNEYTEHFYKAKINTAEDLKKYDIVEDAVKSTLVERKVRINNIFFRERKSQGLRQSLTYDRYSIKQAIRDLELIIRGRKFLTNKFIVKYLVKSLGFSQNHFPAN